MPAQTPPASKFFFPPLAKLAEDRVSNLYILMSTSVGMLAQTALQQATFPDDSASNQAQPFALAVRCARALSTPVSVGTLLIMPFVNGQ